MNNRRAYCTSFLRQKTLFITISHKENYLDYDIKVQKCFYRLPLIPFIKTTRSCPTCFRCLLSGLLSCISCIVALVSPIRYAFSDSEFFFEPYYNQSLRHATSTSTKGILLQWFFAEHVICFNFTTLVR